MRSYKFNRQSKLHDGLVIITCGLLQRPSLVYKGWEGRRLDHPIANLQSTLLVLREFALASLVIAPSRNNIEQEVLLLLANEYHPTCPISMTNPGSLTMGFAEADPRHRVNRQRCIVSFFHDVRGQV